MRCILIGNYGVGNFGDEALKDYFLQTFPEVEWTVLSAFPKAANELPRLPLGLRSFFGTNWWKTIAAFSQTDAIVFGGGSLFTDVESVYACWLWAFHAAVARFFGKPIVLAFQGMGPYKTKIGEWLSKVVARRSVFLSVRDDVSFQRVSFWNLHTKIVQSFDPVFSLFIAQKYTRNPQNVFTIIPRHTSSKTFKNDVKELLEKTGNIQSVHVLSFQPNHLAEEQVCRELLDTVSSSQELKIIGISDIDTLMKELSLSTSVCTQRFHGALAALASGVETKIFPQGEGDKLASLLPYATGSQPIDPLVASIKEGESALRQALESIVLR
jgi:polysaccharide pyruvyl transferase WcaK-like protein